MVFLFGAADRVYVLFDLTYNVQLFMFRVGIVVVPIILFLLTRRWCRELKAGEQVEEIHEQAEAEARARHEQLTSSLR